MKCGERQVSLSPPRCILNKWGRRVIARERGICGRVEGQRGRRGVSRRCPCKVAAEPHRRDPGEGGDPRHQDAHNAFVGGSQGHRDLTSGGATDHGGDDAEAGDKRQMMAQHWRQQHHLVSITFNLRDRKRQRELNRAGAGVSGGEISAPTSAVGKFKPKLSKDRNLEDRAHQLLCHVKTMKMPR